MDDKHNRADSNRNRRPRNNIRRGSYERPAGNYRPAIPPTIGRGTWATTGRATTATTANGTPPTTGRATTGRATTCSPATGMTTWRRPHAAAILTTMPGRARAPATMTTAPPPTAIQTGRRACPSSSMRSSRRLPRRLPPKRATLRPVQRRARRPLPGHFISPSCR